MKMLNLFRLVMVVVAYLNKEEVYAQPVQAEINYVGNSEPQDNMVAQVNMEFNATALKENSPYWNDKEHTLEISCTQTNVTQYNGDYIHCEYLLKKLEDLAVLSRVGYIDFNADGVVRDCVNTDNSRIALFKHSKNPKEVSISHIGMVPVDPEMVKCRSYDDAVPVRKGLKSS